jgi:hypothetical protein
MPARMSTPEYKQCEFEAQKATPPGRSVIADALRINDLTEACMRLKGL